MGKCKSCGADIIFIKTPRGKFMPCDPQPVKYWEQPKAKGKVVTADGEVQSCEFTGDQLKATGTAHIPHWDTCPGANNHRRY